MTAFDEFASAFQASAGFDRDRAESLARLAMTVFDLHAPQEFTAELISPDDGISEGISRGALLNLLMSSSMEPGGSTSFRYRGLHFDMACNWDGLVLQTEDDDWSASLALGGALPDALQAIRDIDLWVDIIRANAD